MEYAWLILNFGKYSNCDEYDFNNLYEQMAHGLFIGNFYQSISASKYLLNREQGQDTRC